MPRVRDDIIFTTISKIHHQAAVKMREIEDFSFSFLDEILREAKKEFPEKNTVLLPKTPTAKASKQNRKVGLSSQRRLILEDDDNDDDNDDDYAPASVKAIKEIEEQLTKKNPPVRKTRAASRKAAKDNSTENNDQTIEPIFNMQKLVQDIKIKKDQQEKEEENEVKENEAEEDDEVEKNDAEEDDALENDAEENEAVENDAEENEAVENDAEEDDALENEAVENDAEENEAEENEAVENDSEDDTEEAAENGVEENDEVEENNAEEDEVDGDEAQDVAGVYPNRVDLNETPLITYAEWTQPANVPVLAFPRDSLCTPKVTQMKINKEITPQSKKVTTSANEISRKSNESVFQSCNASKVDGGIETDLKNSTKHDGNDVKCNENTPDKSSEEETLDTCESSMVQDNDIKQDKDILETSPKTATSTSLNHNTPNALLKSSPCTSVDHSNIQETQSFSDNAITDSYKSDHNNQRKGLSLSHNGTQRDVTPKSSNDTCEMSSPSADHEEDEEEMDARSPESDNHSKDGKSPEVTNNKQTDSPTSGSASEGVSSPMSVEEPEEIRNPKPEPKQAQCDGTVKAKRVTKSVSSKNGSANSSEKSAPIETKGKNPLRKGTSKSDLNTQRKESMKADNGVQEQDNEVENTSRTRRVTRSGVNKKESNGSAERPTLSESLGKNTQRKGSTKVDNDVPKQKDETDEASKSRRVTRSGANKKASTGKAEEPAVGESVESVEKNPRRSTCSRRSLKCPNSKVSLKSLPSKGLSQFQQPQKPVNNKPTIISKSLTGSSRSNLSSLSSKSFGSSHSNNSSNNSLSGLSSHKNSNSSEKKRTTSKKRQHEDDSGEDLNSSKRSCLDGSYSTYASNRNSTDSDYTSPVCPSTKVVRPHPKSFLNSLKSGNNPVVRPGSICNTPLSSGSVKSFIVRNTPVKPSLRSIQEKKKKELMEKAKKNEERMKQRDEEHRRKMEETKKKREEKMKKVLELRKQKEQQEKENRLMLEKRLAERRQLTNKLKEDRIQEEKEKQRIRMQKMEEAEARRKQEEAEKQKKLQEQLEQEAQHQQMLQRKKEYEEMERLKKIEEEKLKMLERQQEIEKERENERERLLKIEEQKEKEWQQKRDERNQQLAAEKARREKLQMEQAREKEEEVNREVERLRREAAIKFQEQLKAMAEERARAEELEKMANKHNSQLQQQAQDQQPQHSQSTKTYELPKPHIKTASISDSPQDKKNDSYEMTPKREKMNSTTENYNIDDLSSNDDTDDDEAPKKRIPDWAQGSYFKSLLIKQAVDPPDLDGIFGPILAPDLNKLFAKKKARFNKRTSSAHWDEPPLKPGNLRRY